MAAVRDQSRKHRMAALRVDMQMRRTSPSAPEYAGMNREYNEHLSRAHEALPFRPGERVHTPQGMATVREAYIHPSALSADPTYRVSVDLPEGGTRMGAFTHKQMQHEAPQTPPQAHKAAAEVHQHPALGGTPSGKAIGRTHETGPSGKAIQRGQKGGQFYIGPSGKKIYV